MIVAFNRLLPNSIGIRKQHDTYKLRESEILYCGNSKPDKYTSENNKLKSSSLIKKIGILLSFLTAMGLKTSVADNTPKWELTPESDGEICLSGDPTIQHPLSPSHNIGWSDNIKVLAARGQEFRSTGSKEEGSHYHKEIINIIRNKQADSLENANTILEKLGYTYKIRNIMFRSFATSTPRQLNSWKISDKTAERYVLLLGQQLPPEESKRFGNQNFNDSVIITLNDMENFFKDPYLYNLTSSSVKRFDDAKYSNITQWIDEIQQKIKNKSNVELLIYYNGHGECLPNTSEFEGDVEGKLLGPQVWEINLKRLINEAFGSEENKDKSIRVLLMMDTCYAGAWIAKNNTNNDYLKNIT